MHKARNTNFFYDLDHGPHQLLAAVSLLLKMMKLNFTGCSIQEETQKKVAHPVQSNYFVYKSSLQNIFPRNFKAVFQVWWEWIFNFDIVHQFLPSIESDLSGNTAWLQASSFQKLAKLTIFGIFVHSKRKHSSLRSHCWMRLSLWFSNTVILFVMHAVK